MKNKVVKKLRHCISLEIEKLLWYIIEIQKSLTFEGDVSLEYVLSHLLTISVLDLLKYNINYLKNRFSILDDICNFFDRDSLCKGKKSRCIVMIIVFLILYLVCGLTTTEWGFSYPLSAIPFIDYSQYLNSTGNAKYGTVGYLVMISYMIGISAIAIKLLNKYILGIDNNNFFSIEGFLYWWLNVYLSANALYLSVSISRYYVKLAEKSLSAFGILFSQQFFIFIIAVLFFMIFSWDAFQNVTSIFLSIPMLKIFCFVKLEYVASFIFCALDVVFGGGLIDIQSSISAFFVLLTQLLWYYFSRTRLAEWLLIVVKLLSTTIFGYILVYVYIIAKKHLVFAILWIMAIIVYYKIVNQFNNKESTK